MGDTRPDTTKEWQLPDHAKPPLVSELVERIDEALATARASEAAVMTVGAAALDAAEQARRAADLAQRASAAMNAPTGGTKAPPVVMAKPAAGTFDDFTARADKVAERLRRLQRLPLSA